MGNVPCECKDDVFLPEPPGDEVPRQTSEEGELGLRNPLKIGATIPDYHVVSTHGAFQLHKWLVADSSCPWTVFFSHPRDFTPVCTTELGECYLLSEHFKKLHTKLLGISCDTLDKHQEWSHDVVHRVHHSLGRSGSNLETELNFPIIADADRRVVQELGIVDPDEVDEHQRPLPARALVILLGTTVKLTIMYPATTGRDFNEIIRVLTALQHVESKHE
mmetsp:Transcript_10658/g.24253  ORF Transcript_10658/g.24253 Transcript_10658/m.24253 type:complete len:219 (-) Transcript_10658:58-714(-)